MIGRNSGMRSIGETTHSAASTRAAFALAGTRASRQRRRSSVTQAGRKPARSLRESWGQAGSEENQQGP